MILGTAGHVDHGKTALVKALTGTDTDRLPEEKRRGMTIELGFASLELPGVGQVGVIDVPGHERFLKAMAAGAGGVDCVLLVIAADEGVKPQTREHLDICGLLGVRAGVVALTKADLLPGLGAGWKELLEADVRAALAGTFLEGAPVLEVSARTGQGLEALEAALAAQLVVAGPSPRAAGPLFLPIDRAFSSKGFGLVVTGTVLSGQVAAEARVSVLPGLPGPYRVRSVQVHGVGKGEVGAGARAALNLPELALERVHRGQAVVAYDSLGSARNLDVELALLPSAPTPLPRRSRQLVNLGTAQVEAIVRLVDLAALRPGERAFAQLRFAGPVAALAGQRFVVRGEGGTLGGGRVLALDPPRRRALSEPRLAQLASRAPAERVAGLLIDAGYQGLGEDALYLAAGLSVAELGTVLADGAAFVPVEEGRAARGVGAPSGQLASPVGRRYVHRSVFEALAQRLLRALDAIHRAHPERPGVPREELRQRVDAPEPIFALALETLQSTRRLERSGELLHLPGLGPRFDPATARLKAELAATLARLGLAPLTPAELARRQQADERRVLSLLQALVSEGLLVRAGDFFFDAAAVKTLQARVLTHFQSHQTLSTQDLKTLTGQSRKFTIPLAEYFDRERLTLRVGELRSLRGR